VLVSAALEAESLQRTTILLANTKPARIYVLRPILEEQADVLSRPELHIRGGSASNCYSSSSTRAISSRHRFALSWPATPTTIYAFNLLVSLLNLAIKNKPHRKRWGLSVV
jgi:hypothetical protein